MTVLAVLALSAAPAFAQAEGDDVQYNGVCQNIIGAIGDINAGNNATATSDANANATAGNGADASASPDAGAGGQADATVDSVAEIAQETGVSIEQVNECLNGLDSADTDNNGDDGDAEEGAGEVDAEKDVLASTFDDGLLPNTGGLPLLAGAGLMLVAATVVGTKVIGRR